MTILIIIIQLVPCQTQHNIWQGSLSSAIWIVLRLTTVCRWRTKGQWKWFHSISPAEFLPTKDLHKVLGRSVSAFASLMREYLDPVVKTDQCAQYVDEIGIVANNATDLTRNIRAVFKCIRQAGVKLTNPKCHFGVTQVELLGRTVSPEGISPQAREI